MDLDITLAGQRLYRSNTNGLIFGVCAGIGQRLGINPWLVRALFVLLSWSLIVPIIYVILGLTIPSEALA